MRTLIPDVASRTSARQITAGLLRRCPLHVHTVAVSQTAVDTALSCGNAFLAAVHVTYSTQSSARLQRHADEVRASFGRTGTVDSSYPDLPKAE